MATPIEMPKLGNTVEECLIARWYKQPGETVASGDIIADIETDKSNFELTSPADGTLLAVFFGEGDLVPVYTTVCVVGSPGESVDQFRPQAATPGVSEPQEPQEPAATSSTQPVPAAATEAGAPRAAMSPRAARFAAEHHFLPAGISGSGPGGRILEEDLRRLYDESRRTSSPTQTPTGQGDELRAVASAAAATVPSGDLAAPPARMSTLRDTIARRMRHSLASTAQYTLNASAVATGLVSLRNRIKSAGTGEDASSININAMVLFCAVKALEAVPEVNVELVDGMIYRHSGIHLGFACDTARGLLVPVIRNSQTLTLRELAARVKALTRQAVDGSISPDDLAGGTFTVSNLGTYGIESFTPILNPPQAAVLGVDAIQLKPVRRNGGVEFVEHIGLSLTCDHQAIDGAPGARFLRTVREQIENVETIAALGL